MYDDGSSEILTGCHCGGKLFFFVKKESLEKAKEVTLNLTKAEKKQIEKDVLDLVGKERIKEEQPVILDFEAISVIGPGKFELDLVRLFKKDPLIYKIGEGKYVIDLPTTFNGFKKRSKKNKKKSNK